MEWRCAWCEKPHEENDPPCDNCGHGEFEKAVVPIAPDGEDDNGESMTVWVCADCGNDHPKHTPPCDRCGGGPLEQQEVTFDQDEVMSEMLGNGDDKSDFSADVGYLDVLDAKLVFAFLAVGALVAILALGFMGIVNVPGISPTPEASLDAPGNGTTVGALSLRDIEREYVDELNDGRRRADFDPVTEDENLRTAATYYNKEEVREAVEGEATDSSDAVDAEIENACDGATSVFEEYTIDPTSLNGGSLASYESETTAAKAIYRQRGVYHTNAERNSVGVDIHVAPDGTVYVTEISC